MVVTRAKDDDSVSTLVPARPSPDLTTQQRTEAVRRIAAVLAQSGEKYCVLHGWQFLEQRDMTDIDLAVAPEALPVLARAVEWTGWQIIQVINYEVGAYFFVAARTREGKGEFLCIDAITDFWDRGRLYLKNSQLLADRDQSFGLTVAAPQAEFAYLLIKKVLKGEIPDYQRSRLTTLCQTLDHRAEETLERFFGAQYGGRLFNWLSTGNWAELHSNISKLRRVLRRTTLIEHFGGSILAPLKGTKRLIGRVLRPSGLMVVLLGPDGSGKSTIARYLQNAFVPTNGRLRYFHFRPDLLRRNLDEVDPNPHLRAIRSTLGSLFKLVYLLFDDIIGYHLFVRPRLVRSDLVVFDRYFPDLMVDPIRYRFGAPLWAARLAGWFIPRPDLFLVLDAPYEVLQGRKSELRTDELKVLRSRYGTLAASLNNAVLLDASDDPIRVAEAASAAIRERLHGRQLARLRNWHVLNGQGTQGTRDRTPIDQHSRSAIEPKSIDRPGKPVTRVVPGAHRALVLDRRAGTITMQLGRMLANCDYTVDIFAERARSKFARVLPVPVWSPTEIALSLGRYLEETEYDVIYLCSEEVLVILVEKLGDELTSGQLRKLPLPPLEVLKTLLSKHATVKLMEQAGIAVPHTIVPHNEFDAMAAIPELGEPFYVKGDRGESGKNVRLVPRANALINPYCDITRDSGGRPALQERIVGPSYSVAGLFKDGQPLRICAHRKLLTWPPSGGWTVKGVTERPNGLLEAACKAFAAINYTGLGHIEFIRDTRFGSDGTYKFIELNPRVWGSVGILTAAGVDFIEPYRKLVAGEEVEPNLDFVEQVTYHRFSGEVRLVLHQPSRLPGFVRDALDRRVHTDFSWADFGTQLSTLVRSKI
jgi:thymidylate kinase